MFFLFAPPVMEQVRMTQHDIRMEIMIDIMDIDVPEVWCYV